MNYNIHYKNWHDDSLEHLVLMSSHYRPIFKLLPTLNDKSNILDIGCGTGFFVKSCLDAGFKNVKGIDISDEQVKVAQNHGLPCIYVSNTFEYLDNCKNSFDLITLFDVIEHIPVYQQFEFISKVHGALKQNGFLLIRTPNANSPFSTRFRYIDFTHTSSFTEYSMEFILLNAGFEQNTITEDFFGRLPIWFPRPSIRGLLRSFFYLFRRANAIAEFGYRDGSKMPLTLNLISISQKK